MTCKKTKIKTTDQIHAHFDYEEEEEVLKTKDIEMGLLRGFHLPQSS